MIFTSHPDLVEEVHLYLDDMVQEVHGDHDEDGTPESRTFEPEGAAVCGADPQVGMAGLTPASETWASNVMDLLGTNGVCEDCRTRVALYYDMAEDVTLSVTSGYITCKECGTTTGKPTLTRVWRDEDGTSMADLDVRCHECDEEWELEVPLERGEA